MGILLGGATEHSKALMEAGNILLNPHSSTDLTLCLLDGYQTVRKGEIFQGSVAFKSLGKFLYACGLLSFGEDLTQIIESLLTTVEQHLTVSLQNVLLPSMKALVSDDLLRNPDSDVRVSVVSCLTQIMRITAPKAPYNDDQLKEIFQVTIEAFGKLADVSSRSYTKAELVLETVSKFKTSVVMLDLECDDLILEMFRQFLKNIRPDHPQLVLFSMEKVMVTVIDESEEVSKDLLDILLTTVEKKNLNVSPTAMTLVEKVLSSCAHKLKPGIMDALKSTGTSLDMYSPVVSSICKEEEWIEAEDEEGWMEVEETVKLLNLFDI